MELLSRKSYPSLFSIRTKVLTLSFAYSLSKFRENLAIGSLVGQLQASDPDAQTTLNFTLVEGSLDTLFNLDANGTLRTATVLDYETLTELTIRAKVRDPFNSGSRKTLRCKS